MVSVASAAAHPMHGQWTWRNTPTGPGAALEDSAATDVFLKKGSIRALTVRLRSGGTRIHSSRHGALRIFDEKKSCPPPVEQQMLTNPPSRRTSASKQTPKAPEIDTVLHSQKMLKNRKTKCERRNNKAIMHQSFSRRYAWEELKQVPSEEEQCRQLRVHVTHTDSETNCF